MLVGGARWFVPWTFHTWPGRDFSKGCQGPKMGPIPNCNFFKKLLKSNNLRFTLDFSFPIFLIPKMSKKGPLKTSKVGYKQGMTWPGREFSSYFWKPSKCSLKNLCPVISYSVCTQPWTFRTQVLDDSYPGSGRFVPVFWMICTQVMADSFPGSSHQN